MQTAAVKGIGGGVYISGGTFKMEGGTISSYKATHGTPYPQLKIKISMLDKTSFVPID